MRCADVPCVKLSGTTTPCVWRWSVSSPIASAARMPSSTSPGSSTTPEARARVGPHPGIAIGLKLDRDLLLVAVRSAAQLALEVLDVVADFVGDDIGLGEIARRAEAAAQFVEEGRVDVNALVGRAVERPHRRLRRAAARLAAAACRRPASARCSARPPAGRFASTPARSNRWCRSASGAARPSASIRPCVAGDVARCRRRRPAVRRRQGWSARNSQARE